jgi:hypothetical protein
MCLASRASTTLARSHDADGGGGARPGGSGHGGGPDSGDRLSRLRKAPSNERSWPSQRRVKDLRALRAHGTGATSIEAIDGDPGDVPGVEWSDVPIRLVTGGRERDCRRDDQLISTCAAELLAGAASRPRRTSRPIPWCRRRHGCRLMAAMRPRHWAESFATSHHSVTGAVLARHGVGLAQRLRWRRRHQRLRGRTGDRTPTPRLVRSGGPARVRTWLPEAPRHLEVLARSVQPPLRPAGWPNRADREIPGQRGDPCPVPGRADRVREDIGG